MLKLSNRKSDVTRTIELLPGVTVDVRPVEVANILIARRAAGEVFRADPEGQETQTHAGIGLIRSIVHQGVVSWTGIGDEDGNPAPVTEDAIDKLLELWPAYEAFDRLYVTPALVLEAEKNG